MPKTINARIPPHVEQKLADYCARSGATRSQTVVKALDEYLDKQAGGPDAYSLAADLIPRRGAPASRSDRVRELARKAFRGSRAG
jgi:predicted DNA-binding protein